MEAMSGHDSQASRNDRIVDAKQVFLSHSGAQKDFVEQLDVDLRTWDRYPFFDKDRESLPIGEAFPKLIFDAIQKCQLGVVFLSEEFFMRSQWPMLEVVKMVECGKKIMPVFLGIYPGDLSDEVKLRRWKSQWQIWAKFNERIILSEWENALKWLRKLNGLVCNYGKSDVEFRREIVKEISKIVPPFHMWDDSHVQGRSHINQAIHGKVMKASKSQIYGIQVVGFYGVGGIGKTTACKSMCKHLFTDFEGRVCHVEFGNATSEKERLCEVLKRLTETNIEVLKELTIEQCWSRLNDLMRMKKVYLAIDNVSDTYSEETKKYLQAGYYSGSIVMVTARGLGELISLRIGDGDCFELPELEVDDARALFLYHAQANKAVDEEVLMHYVNRCYFSKGDGSNSHYHPLALKVLGSELASNDPEEWKMPLEAVDTFNQQGKQDHPVYSILRKSFDELRDKDKLLFMDVALYGLMYSQIANRWRWTSNIFEWLSMVHGLSIDDVMKGLKRLKRKSLLEELGDGTRQTGMHDLWREFAVEETMRGDTDNGRWVCEVVEGEAVDSMLFGGGWNGLLSIGIMAKSGRYGHIENKSVKCVNLSSCSKVRVFRLVNVEVENEMLDLSALKQLKCLEIVYNADFNPVRTVVSGIRLLTSLTMLIWRKINVESRSAVEEISYLTNLQVLKLHCDVDGDFFKIVSQAVSAMLDFGKLRWLREVRIKLNGKLSISGLNSKMTNLRILDLEGCHQLRRCPGVGGLICLEELVISNCSELEELPNLENLSKLLILDISCCTSLKAVEGLGSLVALVKLRAGCCGNLCALPDLGRLTNLQVLDLTYSMSLRYVPGLGNLNALLKFCGGGPFLEDLPDRGNLEKLQTVFVDFRDPALEPGRRQDDQCSPQEVGRVLNLTFFEFVSSLDLYKVDHELASLSKMVALRNLRLSKCGFQTLSGLSSLSSLETLYLAKCKLRRLPDMGSNMRLESLYIWKCKWLQGWDGVGRLRSSESRPGDLHCDWTLPHLKALEWMDSAIIELPDLSHFPRLIVIVIYNDIVVDNVYHGLEFALHCFDNHPRLEVLVCKEWPINELPDLSKFPCLRELALFSCDSLTSLTSRGPLTTLKILHLDSCMRLTAFPDLGLFTNLTDISIQRCRVELTVQTIEGLRARCPRPRLRMDALSWDFDPAAPRIETILPVSERDCDTDVVLTTIRPDNPVEAAGSSSTEGAPCCSESAPRNKRTRGS